MQQQCCHNFCAGNLDITGLSLIKILFPEIWALCSKKKKKEAYTHQKDQEHKLDKLLVKAIANKRAGTKS